MTFKESIEKEIDNIFFYWNEKMAIYIPHHPCCCVDTYQREFCDLRTADIRVMDRIVRIPWCAAAWVNASSIYQKQGFIVQEATGYEVTCNLKNDESRAPCLFHYRMMYTFEFINSSQKIRAIYDEFMDSLRNVTPIIRTTNSAYYLCRDLLRAVPQSTRKLYREIKTGKQRKRDLIDTKDTSSVKRSGGYVYIVRGVGTTLHKIGKSLNVQARVANLQSSSPVKLEILKTVYFGPVGYTAAERATHKQFAASRKHGEWFDFLDSTVPIKYLEELKKVRTF